VLSSPFGFTYHAWCCLQVDDRVAHQMALAQPRLLLVPEEQAAARLADLAALLKVGFLVESHSLGGEGVREFMAL
jgi:hypothetical protein